MIFRSVIFAFRDYLQEPVNFVVRVTEPGLTMSMRMAIVSVVVKMSSAMIKESWKKNVGPAVPIFGKLTAIGYLVPGNTSEHIAPAKAGAF